MLLSIVVPSFNQRRFIGATLDSILAQAYPSFEIIVVDGASTDGTPDLLRDYAARHANLRWLSEPDGGPADAVNKGLALAQGPVTAIQSSDDLYVAGAFEAAMAVFAERPGCGLVIGDYQGIGESGESLYVEEVPDFSWEAYFARSLMLPQSSMFFRTDLARDIGGWNARYYSCDLDLWLRLMLRAETVHLPQVLSSWRLYRGQRTHKPEAQAKIWHGYWAMIDECPELRQAPTRVRRLARASRHLLAMRFHPTHRLWAVRWHLLQGALLHPTFWRDYPWDAARWVPGVQRWRKWTGRERDWFSGKPIGKAR